MSEKEIDHRKVYAKGFYDGLAAKGEKMSSAVVMKSQIIGLTGIAKKVYDATPQLDYWPVKQIIGEIQRATKSRPDMTVVMGCLKSLKEQGLIREDKDGCYTKVPVKEKPVNPAPEALHFPTKAQPEPEQKSSFDALVSLGKRLNDVAAQINNIVAELENVVLAIEQEKQDGEKNMQQLRQFQSLLKTLSAGG